MNYRETGNKFCNEINTMLKLKCPDTTFVTGGGYAYDSIKYSDNNYIGDYDFMIVYKNQSDVVDIISNLKSTNFVFEDKYLNMDLEMLKNNDIDIIRLSGNYMGNKSTVNLVPISLIKELCDLKKERIIRKIAHNRNTSLFFAYGTNNSRITVNFISPSFVTSDNEDHYIHLDFSCFEKDNNIYLGILSDAILKGFNKNYDGLGFESLRKCFIKNINNYFQEKNIDISSYIGLFANNNYFPVYLKEKLLHEFESFGISKSIERNNTSNEPIIFTTDFNLSYEKKPFNFINNKEYKMDFMTYILKMQNNEYDRQYLIDAIGKFYGYLISIEHGNELFNSDNIFKEIKVFGVNDLYLDNASKYSIESIIDLIIHTLLNSNEIFNNEFIKQIVSISCKFLSIYKSVDYNEILKKYDLSYWNFPSVNDSQMDINFLERLDNFNEFGTYHNITSKVMPNYSENESHFLKGILGENKYQKILDIMCGYGRIANKLKELGYQNIFGIDSETYNIFNISKDFTFIHSDFFKYNFDNKFDFAYSLYNCYPSNEYLFNILSKTHLILNNNAQFVIDCFNKEWRDSINPYFEKKLYDDGNNSLIVKREYDNYSGIEITKYILYKNGFLIKEFQFEQKFFDFSDIDSLVDKNMWNCELLDSSIIHSRNNNQKHILILRKK